MKKVVIQVEGIDNDSYKKEIEESLKKQDGIKKVFTSIKDKKVTIYYKKLNIETIEKYIKDVGFEPVEIDLININKKPSIISVIVVGIISLLLICILLANQFNLPLMNSLKLENKLYAIISLIISIILIIKNIRILKKGLLKINVNTLIDLGIIMSFILGIINLINNNTNIVGFDYIIFILFFKELGAFLDKNSQYKINMEIKQVSGTNISKAHIRDNDSYREVSIKEVKAGDKIICLPGDRILLDGTIVEGVSHIDESILTGESLSREKKEKSNVLAGTLNCEKEIEYRVEKRNIDTYKSEIKKMVLDNNKNNPFIRSVDQISKLILPSIVIISILVLSINFIVTRDIINSISKFLIVYMVFGSFSIITGTSLACYKYTRLSNQRGILIKDNGALEIINNIDTFIFDKTGTLTNGYAAISKINRHSELEEKEVLNIIGSIEKHSTHALARGITKYIKNERIKTTYDFITEDLPGYGVKAKDDKDIYYACNGELLKKLDIINSYKEEERKLKIEGNEVVYLVKNNKVIATLGLKDTIRKDINKLIKNLKEKNKEVILLTGDNETVTNKIAKELEIDNAVAGLNAKEKLEFINKKQKEGKRVIFIGDGINDAPALKKADIGVALKNISDIPLIVADIILTNNGVFKVLDLINFGKNVIKRIKLNIFISLITSLMLLIISFGIIPILTINTLWIISIMLFGVGLIVLNSLR